MPTDKPYTVIGLSVLEGMLAGKAASHAGLAVAEVVAGHHDGLSSEPHALGMARWTVRVMAVDPQDAERQAALAWQHLATGDEALTGDTGVMEVTVRSRRKPRDRALPPAPRVRVDSTTNEHARGFLAAVRRMFTT